MYDYNGVQFLCCLGSIRAAIARVVLQEEDVLQPAMSDSEVEVDSQDVLRLILQFLKENGLQQSLDTLQAETQVPLNTVENRDQLMSDIKKGRWDDALNVVSTLQLPSKILYDLYEQIVLEMIELREIDASRLLLRKTPALLRLRADDPDRYIRLEHLMSRPLIEERDLYPAGDGKESRRAAIADAIGNEVMVVAPSRLLSIIGQALKWQQHLGLLPSGTKFDVFRGQAPSKGRNSAEAIPDTEWKIIKLGSTTQCNVCRFSPDGLWLVTGSSDGFVEVWSASTGKLETKQLKYQAEDKLMVHRSGITSMVFSKDGELLSTGDQTGGIKVWKLKTGQCLRKFPDAHDKDTSVSSLAFAPKEAYLVSGGFDGTVRVHGLKSGRTLRILRGHKSPVTSVHYTPDGTHVISGSLDGTIRIWDSKADAECVKIINMPDGAAVLSIEMCPAPAKERFFVTTKSATCFIVNWHTGEIYSRYTLADTSSASSTFTAGCLSAHGGWVYGVVGDEDRGMYCWESALKSTKDGGTGTQIPTSSEPGGGFQPELKHIVKVHDAGEVLSVAHHPHQNLMATAGTDHTIRLWQASADNKE